MALTEQSLKSRRATVLGVDKDTQRPMLEIYLRGLGAARQEKLYVLQ